MSTTAHTTSETVAVAPGPRDGIRGWGTVLAGASAIGMVSGSISVMDKIALLKDPAAGSFCDVSSTVGCSPVLLAWQSSVLGPPNALLGVLMFAVLGTTGAIAATGGAVTRGWRVGMLGLSVFFGLFLTWYMQQVAFAVGSLCPFCTVCAGSALVAILATNRMLVGSGGRVGHMADSLARGKNDVLIVVGWGAIIAAMIYAGIWL